MPTVCRWQALANNAAHATEVEQIKAAATDQLKWMQQQHQRAVEDWEAALTQFEAQAAANAGNLELW